MLYYQQIILENQDSLIVATDKDGRCFAYLQKRNGKMMCLVEGQVNFSGLNGFLKSTGLRGETIREQLAHGLPCISNALPHSLECISTEKCSGDSI